VTSKHGPYRRLSATLALLGLLVSSTVVAWAVPCDDDCPSVKQVHSCCPPAQEPVHQTRASAPDCCGGDLDMACGTSATFETTTSSAAHKNSDSLASAAGHVDLITELPRPEPTASPPPLPAPSPPPATRTVVLLL
jgi:hypothetical protein